MRVTYMLGSWFPKILGFPDDNGSQPPLPIPSLESLPDLGVGCEWIRKRPYDQSQGLSALRGEGGRAPGWETPGRQFIQGRHHTQRSKPRRKLYPGMGFTREGTRSRESATPRESPDLEKACTQGRCHIQGGHCTQGRGGSSCTSPTQELHPGGFLTHQWSSKQSTS